MEEIGFVANLIDEDVVRLEQVNLRMSWIFRRQLEKELDGFHLTVPQYIALNCIHDSEQGCSMSALAESAHQVSATMTGIIDRLADRGLVVRTRDPRDRRAMRVVLTPAGHELLERVSAYKQKFMARFLTTLSDDERQGLIGMAERYLLFIEQSMRDGAATAAVDLQADSKNVSRSIR